MGKSNLKWVSIDSPIVKEWVKDHKWFLLYVKGIPTTGDYRVMQIGVNGDWWLGGYGWYRDFKGDKDMICICPQPNIGE